MAQRAEKTRQAAQNPGLVAAPLRGRAMTPAPWSKKNGTDPERLGSGSTSSSRSFLDFIEVSSIILKMKSMPVPLVIPADLRSRVARIARKASSKQAEVYRLAIRCGLAEAEKRLVSEPARLFPNIDPFPPGVLDRWYRRKDSRDWEKMETDATRAQSIPTLEE
jgi:hypothetical protein